MVFAERFAADIFSTSSRTVLLDTSAGNCSTKCGRSGQRAFSIEHQLQLAGAETYLIVVGTNATGGYDDLDHRFDSWPAPVNVSLADNWVGELPVFPVISG